MNLTNASSGINATASPPYELYSNIGKIVGYSSAYGLISIVGLIGSLMVLMVMTVNRAMHTATNLLLLNLSISDILFIIFTVPGLLALEICNGRWCFGVIMAKITAMLNIISGASSVFTMMVIALDRYIAVIYPLKHMARKKKGTVIVAMIFIWVCSIALSIPLGVHTNLDHFVVAVTKDGRITEERKEISFIWITMEKEASKFYLTVVFVFLFVIPILALALLYSKIVWKLWNPDRQLNERPDGAQGKAKNFVSRARRKTTIMLVVILVAFFVCWLPYNLFTVIITNVGHENFDKDTIRKMQSILPIFVTLNSATNPIIYNFFSERFRVGFRNIFSCRCHVAARVETTDGETIGETVLA